MRIVMRVAKIVREVGKGASVTLVPDNTDPASVSTNAAFWNSSNDTPVVFDNVRDDIVAALNLNQRYNFDISGA
jgi:hypothetical protein